MVERIKKEESKAIYDKRKVIVEPAIGHIKNSGFRGFRVRGTVKVAAEFSLICLTHNLKKNGESGEGRVNPSRER